MLLAVNTTAKPSIYMVINMAKHEFGIMYTAPAMKREYNDYEPAKYHCIYVEDKNIEPLLNELSEISCYWNSLERAEKGLAYSGITIIPPRSLEKFISVIDGKTQLNELKDLLRKAAKENKYVIHFGI